MEAVMSTKEMAGRMRVLIAKCGVDGHERGARLVARALMMAGMEVIYLGHSPRGVSPEAIVATAEQEGVDVVGLSILSPIYHEMAGKVIGLLKEKDMEDIPVVVGGVIPRRDIPELQKIGVKAVFRQNTPLDEIVNYFKTLKAI